MAKYSINRNAGQDRFAPGVEIASGTNRCFTYPVDWDADGKPDVILSWATGPSIYLNRGMAANVLKVRCSAREAHAVDPAPGPMAVDWDRDGDTDLMLASSYALLHFASLIFLSRTVMRRHGFEMRGDSRKAWPRICDLAELSVLSVSRCWR